jgi:hypothetical protein
MKIRNGFVSNSSSSSFVIHNWFDLSEDKRYYIENYDINALEIWQKKKIKYKKEKELSGYIQDFPFIGEEYYYDCEYENRQKYNFGWINNSCRWKFIKNEEKNECIVKTSMDNFNMELWLRYNKIDFDNYEWWNNEN